MRYSPSQRILLSLGLMVLVVAAIGAVTTESQSTQPNIEGTYRLVKRDLPNGGSQQAPAVIGLMTFTRECRNFNIYWNGEGGKRFSISAISKYSLDADTYRETNVYYLVNDEIGGKGLSYDLASDSRSSPVTRSQAGIEFQLPLHGEPKLVFTDKGFTASREGEFVDHWERIK